MGGKIRADSELDRGSTFHFNARFRVQDSATAVATALTHAVTLGTAHPMGTPSPLSKPLRILVADDSADNRMLITAFLKKMPYCIDEVENGALAVEHFKARMYDLVLMDIQMPVMDGYEATRLIKADSVLKSIPVIAVTSYALSGDEDKARAAGCDGYVAKPFSPRQMLAKVREILG